MCWPSGPAATLTHVSSPSTGFLLKNESTKEVIGREVEQSCIWRLNARQHLFSLPISSSIPYFPEQDRRQANEFLPQ